MKKILELIYKIENWNFEDIYEIKSLYEQLNSIYNAEKKSIEDNEDSSDEELIKEKFKIFDKPICNKNQKLSIGFISPVIAIDRHERVLFNLDHLDVAESIFQFNKISEKFRNAQIEKFSKGIIY
jgi:hypothetical protein